jgi:hypothetical protein
MDAQAEGATWTVGIVDMTVLLGLITFAVYWFFIRQKKEEPFKFPMK